MKRYFDSPFRESTNHSLPNSTMFSGVKLKSYMYSYVHLTTMNIKYVFLFILSKIYSMGKIKDKNNHLNIVHKDSDL